MRQIIRILFITACAFILSATASCEGDIADERRQASTMPLQLQVLCKGMPQDLNLVILPEAFRMEDMPLFEEKVLAVRRALQVSKPFCYLMDRINIYYSTALVSESNEMGSGRTALGCGRPFKMEIPLADDSISKAYRSTGLDTKRTVLLILVNTDIYAGCTYFYGNEYYVVCPAHNAFLLTTVIHELGHAIGLLADEYVERQEPSNEDLAKIRNFQKEGFYLNVSTDDFDVPWKEILADKAFEKESPGVYEGGALFKTGIYRSSANSVMRTHMCGHNVIGRFLIYKRIVAFHKGQVPQYSEFRQEDIACDMPDIKWLELLSPVTSGRNKARQQSQEPGSYGNECIIWKK